MTLGSHAPALRRELGPTAWVVLEDLVTRSQSTNGHIAVDASTASIVESVGLGRDCVRAALRRLAKASVIVPSSARDGHGRFASPVVELHLPADTISPEGAGSASVAARSRSRAITHDHSAIAGEPVAGEPVAGEPVAGKPAPVANTTSRKQRPARTTSTRPTERDNQLSLLAPDPA
jgi:hypothetical protein